MCRRVRVEVTPFQKIRCSSHLFFTGPRIFFIVVYVTPHHCITASLANAIFQQHSPSLTTTMSANDSSSRLQSTRLSYTIAGCSEHSNRYVADNITVDAPTDPNSRWSGQHESPSIKQWILLRLDRLGVIGEFLTRPMLDCHSNTAQDSITFGKVLLQHLCIPR